MTGRGGVKYSPKAPATDLNEPSGGKRNGTGGGRQKCVGVRAQASLPSSISPDRRYRRKERAAEAGLPVICYWAAAKRLNRRSVASKEAPPPPARCPRSGFDPGERRSDTLGLGETFCSVRFSLFYRGTVSCETAVTSVIRRACERAGGVVAQTRAAVRDVDTCSFMSGPGGAPLGPDVRAGRTGGRKSTNVCICPLPSFQENRRLRAFSRGSSCGRGTTSRESGTRSKRPALPRDFCPLLAVNRARLLEVVKQAKIVPLGPLGPYLVTFRLK